jgi:hypothetical protein
MVFPVKLFKNNNKPYRLLAVEDNGEVIWAETVNDKATIAGNRMLKGEFNKMLREEGWESDVNTMFTFADGEFQPIEHEHETAL